MRQTRAAEVLQLGAQYSEYRKHMTPDEVDYVLAGWKRMPGFTCFHDALLRVYRQQHPFDKDGLLNEVLHVT